MSRPIKTCPECVYGNPCTMICINANCRKPAFMCEHGLNSKTECSLFHEKCQKMAWSQLDNIICQNPNTKIPELFTLQQEMQLLFSNLIKKVKDQHMNFKKWLSLFGFNQQTMNFINMVNDNKYNNISGVYMNQVLSNLFMNEDKVLQTNFNAEECQKAYKVIEHSLDRIKELYMLDCKKETMSFSTNATLGSFGTNDIAGFNSKITQDHGYIRSLFPKQNIKNFNLLYRASQHNFSALEFHKKCDNIEGTITIVETEYGKIIGGYTPLAWNSSKKHWAADKSMTSFIFSLDLRERFNLNLAQFAIACNPEKGPIFGCCDICLVDNSNIEKSNAEFPISYNNFKYARNPQSSQAFTGNMKGRFTTKEWEVYKIQFME